jgi:hypothetical protein
VKSTGKNVNEATVTTDEGASDSDTATVNGIGAAVPKIDCRGSLSWTNIPPGSTQTGTFTVGNIGDPGSLLKWKVWKVCDYPTWGTWSFSPSNGTGLTTLMVTLITVTVVAPNQQNQQFTGRITLCNEEDSTDTCNITVSLATPKNKRSVNPLLLSLERLIERFPILEQILQPIYDKLAGFY